jgi:hypothetical protein
MYIRFGSISEIQSYIQQNANNTSIDLSEIQPKLRQTDLVQKLDSMKSLVPASEMPQINLAALMMSVAYNMHGSCAFNSALFAGRDPDEMLEELTDTVNERMQTKLSSMTPNIYLLFKSSASVDFKYVDNPDKLNELLKDQTRKLLDKYKHDHYLKTAPPKEIKENRDQWLALTEKREDELAKYKPGMSKEESGKVTKSLNAIDDEIDKLRDQYSALSASSFKDATKQQIPEGMVFMFVCGFSGKTGGGHNLICLARENDKGELKTGVVDPNQFPDVVFNALVDNIKGKAKSELKHTSHSNDYMYLETGFLTKEEEKNPALMSMMTFQKSPLYEMLNIYKLFNKIDKVTFETVGFKMPSNTFPIHTVSPKSMFNIIDVQTKLVQQIDTEIIKKLSYWQRIKLLSSPMSLLSMALNPSVPDAYKQQK